MSRQVIRDLKRRLSDARRAPSSEGHAALARAAAVDLLERSVRMQHRRLAVQRLQQAVALGAEVPLSHWRYCLEAATTSRDDEMKTLFQRSLHAARPLPALAVTEDCHG